MTRQLLETAKVLVDLLKAGGLTCATAESCTGGLVAAAITSVPGSSAVFPGSVVSYACDVKHRVLGVPQTILHTVGPVSGDCARAMAEGVRKLMKADLAVSITGIAGPDGGSAEKPVGLVWFAVATASGTKADHAIFRGDRAGIRENAAIHALGLLTVAAAP